MRIHRFLMVAGLIVILSACSSGNSLPSAVPSGSASGTVLDGLILNGTVTAYDFSSGTQGAVLGQATTDSATGAYSLSLQVESRPILLEITGGYYTEESAPAGTTNTVTLDPTDHLTALINYTTGAAVTVSLTAFTHLAAGLAEYEIKTGVPVASAVDDANQRVSQLAGLDIIHTTPLEVTDINNASANPTPGLEYGFLAAGISQWVLDHTPSGVPTPLQQPYTSIKFDQLMHDDVAADGLLDGEGLDPNGVKIGLSFGTTALSPTVYRQGIGVSVLEFAAGSNPADSTSNKTGLTPGNSPSFLTWAEAYAANTDKMFDGVAPLAITIPSITIISPSASAGWLRATQTVSAAVQDYSGLTSDSLSVDGGAPQTMTTTLSSPSWPLDTTTLADGPHTVVVSATNVAGLTGSATVSFRVDNTPPSLTLGSASFIGTTTGPAPIATYGQCALTGVVSDSGSGPAGSVTASWTADPIVPTGESTAAGLVNNAFSLMLSPVDVGSNATVSTPIALTVRDAAGNSITYSHTLNVTTTSCARTPFVGCQFTCTVN